MKISDLERMLATYRARFGDDEIAFYKWDGSLGHGVVDLTLTEMHDGYVTRGGQTAINRECEIRIRSVLE